MKTSDFVVCLAYIMYVATNWFFHISSDGGPKLDQRKHGKDQRIVFAAWNIKAQVANYITLDIRRKCNKSFIEMSFSFKQSVKYVNPFIIDAVYQLLV